MKLWGRRAEVAQLECQLHDTRRGFTQLTTVGGASGIGKTALLHHTTSEADRNGFDIIAGSAEQHSALLLAICHSATRAPRDRHDAVRPGDGPTPGDPHVDAALDAAIGSPTHHRPLLVAIDDVSWDAPEVRLALTSLPLAYRSRPVLWALAGTGTPPSPTPAPTRKAMALELPPLDEHAAHQLAGELLCAPPGMELSSLTQAAGGHPGLLTAVLTTLTRESDVSCRRGRAAPDRPGALRQVLPLLLRCDPRLSPRARSVVTLATTLPPEFRPGDLLQLLDRAAFSLLPAVRETCDAGVWNRGRDHMAFRHPLLREAAAATLSPAAHEEMARACGTTMLERARNNILAVSGLSHPGDDSEEELAHAVTTEARETLPHFTELAAELTARELRNGDGGTTSTGKGTVRAMAALASAGRTAEALALAAPHRPPSAEYPQVRQFAAELRLFEQPRTASGEAEALLSDGRLSGPVARSARAVHLAGLAVTDPERAHALVEELRDERSGGGGGSVAASALWVEAQHAWLHGRTGDAMDLLGQALLSTPPRWGLHLRLVRARWRANQRQIRLAAAELDEMEKEVARHGGPRHTAHLQLAHAHTQMAVHRYTAARDSGTAALSAAEHGQAPLFTFHAAPLVALAELRLGDVEGATAWLSRVDERSDECPAWEITPELLWARLNLAAARRGVAHAGALLRRRYRHMLSRPASLLLHEPCVGAWLVRALLAARDRESASLLAGRAKELADRARASAPHTTLSAEHARALCDRDQEALELVSSQHPDPLAAAHAAEDLAAARADVGGPGSAEVTQAYRLALERYERLGLVREVLRIRHVLRGRGGRLSSRQGKSGAPRASSLGDLTPAERDTALLASDGFTNQQIASRLHVSPHTVNFHLRKVYRKLGVASRTELAGRRASSLLAGVWPQGATVAVGEG